MDAQERGGGAASENLLDENYRVLEDRILVELGGIGQEGTEIIVVLFGLLSSTLLHLIVAARSRATCNSVTNFSAGPFHRTGILPANHKVHEPELLLILAVNLKSPVLFVFSVHLKH
jgi:hypothetical protein